MKKPTEHNELLSDVIGQTGTEEFRSATLQHGLAEMRHTRARRRAMRITVILAVALLFTATLLFVQDGRDETLMTNLQPLQTPIAKTIEGTPIRVVSDEELLDLFKGRPVALVGPPGNQRLLLLDEGAN